MGAITVLACARQSEIFHIDTPTMFLLVHEGFFDNRFSFGWPTHFLY